jgi:Second Messenger Oligonucleotide or Dinucleotide Synthetase domain
MAKTVSEAFDKFHGWLTPTDGETQAAKSHRASIEKCLKDNFGLLRFFLSGSFGNGTSIKGYSDVDRFASIPASNLWKSSTYSLRMIRNQLNTTFYSTNIRVDDPAIVCPFGTNAMESTDVVPCYYYEKIKGFSVYKISDTNEGWMKASPEMHNAFVRQENKRLKGKLKPLIRFIKAWNFYRNAKISSFYLELRITKLMESEDTIVYSVDIKNILKWLYDNNLPAIQDPMGISGLILPCKTSTHKLDAISKLDTAKKRAERAREFEAAEKIEKAFEQWNLLYNENFPAYY